MPSKAVHVRSAEAADHDAFLEMWADFVAFALPEPGDGNMGGKNWDRIASGKLQCIVALGDDGAPIGFVLFLAVPFAWSNGDACYLQDIYVRPEHRGQGVARAMIEHLREAGRAARWFKIFWMTESSNHPAQRLYDTLAKRADYIRYDLMI